MKHQQISTKLHGVTSHKSKILHNSSTLKREAECFYETSANILKTTRRHISHELIGNADIVRFIKSRRIAWLGHVMRMDDKRTPNRILQWKPIGTRTRGRPRKRWIAGIEEDLQIMGVRRWRKQCEERAEWKKITEEAKTHSGS